MTTKPDFVVRYLVRRDAIQAEVGLMIAVLDEAIGCFRKHLLARDKKRQRLFREADTWIMSEEDDRAFSFNHVCDVVGLHAAYTRRLLRQWRDQQLAAKGLLPHPVSAKIRVERRERRKFTNEFKAETAQLVREGGRRIRTVARELDLDVSVVWRWVQDAAIGAPPAGVLTTTEREELRRLRRDNQARTQRARAEEASGLLAKKIA